ncbi:MAG: carbamoyltransferase HypF [Thermodesulfobacteriota bacterium]
MARLAAPAMAGRGRLGPTGLMAAEAVARWRISVRGMVQGVGFRPFVHRLATARDLAGFVTNTPAGVVLEVEGASGRLEDFLAALKQKQPPLARIDAVEVETVAPFGEAGFSVRVTQGGAAATALIPPDITVCDDCLAELFDPANRRYRYPFINCTNCGPRFTIIEKIPYDRPHTTMRHFPMCAECGREYHDPADRRFHAQPNACPVCGPRLTLHGSDSAVLALGDAALAGAGQRLADGGIVAIKGVGGFHLAVDAANEAAVARLRQRKGREAKPLAVMAADLAMAHRLCVLSSEEAAALASPERPILLAQKRNGHGLAEAVAPECGRFGVMLPYTPLHHLLLRDGPPVLVMTSGNASEEPICTGNAEAMERLAGIADAFLCHDRGIRLSCDDSVMAWQAGALRQVRRSRGYAPRPLPMPADGPVVLAVGGELKNTVCLARGMDGFVGQHLGDLKNLASYRAFTESIALLTSLLEAPPELLVHDLHPAYLSTQWASQQAQGQGLPVLAVQHHHAHLAACLAENREAGPAIGLILDGAGLGPDQTVWGGEVLVGDAAGFSRFASLEPMPLPGGDAAVREPWRLGVGYLAESFGGQVPELPFLAAHDWAMIPVMVARRFNTPLVSSCGRLFDAVAAMAGGRQQIRYEAEAAIGLMEATGELGNGPGFACAFMRGEGLLRLSVTGLIREVADAVASNMGLSEVSRRFHHWLIQGLTHLAREARQAHGLTTVALSGGVFLNHLLLEGLTASLAAQGFRVLTHRQLPCGDGCLSYGQAVIGRQWLEKGGGRHAGDLA